MWKKGESGNPAGAGGHPKRRLITSQIERELLTLADGDATKARRIAEKVVEMALAGNAWAVQFVTERTEGRPDQNINIRRVVAELSEDELRAIASGSSQGAAVSDSSAQEFSKFH